MSRTKTKRIAVIAVVFMVAMVVVLVVPGREEPVIVKGDLSGQDVKEIKRAALKELRQQLWEYFKSSLKFKAYHNAVETLKVYHSLKVTRIESIDSDVALVYFKTGKTNGAWPNTLAKQTDGWHLKYGDY